MKVSEQLTGARAGAILHAGARALTHAAEFDGLRQLGGATPLVDTHEQAEWFVNYVAFVRTLRSTTETELAAMRPLVASTAT